MYLDTYDRNVKSVLWQLYLVHVFTRENLDNILTPTPSGYFNSPLLNIHGSYD